MPNANEPNCRVSCSCYPPATAHGVDCVNRNGVSIAQVRSAYKLAEMLKSSDKYLGITNQALFLKENEEQFQCHCCKGKKEVGKQAGNLSVHIALASEFETSPTFIKYSSTSVVNVIIQLYNIFYLFSKTVIISKNLDTYLEFL